jgi:hypothetical protein
LTIVARHTTPPTRSTKANDANDAREREFRVDDPIVRASRRCATRTTGDGTDDA